MAHGLLRRATRPLGGLGGGTGFLAADVREAVRDEDFLHPWLATCRDVAPAKFLHIADLIDLQSYYFSFGRAAVADLVYPLFSQPVIELCLRIPTYVLTQGGRDRALARRAFAGMVPAPILARETKGDITSFYNRVLSREIELVRALLLEGMLAEQRLLDRARLERHLREDHVMRGDRIVDIMVYLCVEAWARTWADAGKKAAA